MVINLALLKQKINGSWNIISITPINYKPIVTTTTLYSDNWVLDSDTQLYTQQISVSGLSENSKVDLDTDISALASIPSSIYPVNNSGVLYVKTSKPPEVDVSVQLTITNINYN